MTERALLAKWRDALRDSELDMTAKACGYVIATYWNGRGLSAGKAFLVQIAVQTNLEVSTYSQAE